MTKLDAFSAEIVRLVRGMSDEAILALVRNQLGVLRVTAAPAAPRRVGSGRPVGRPKGAKRVAKRATKKAVVTARPKKRAKAQRTGTRRSVKRQKLLAEVERIIKSSKGVSVSQVAGKTKASKSRVSAAIRELKAAKRVYQGGDRRFARYAGDARAARKASTDARQSAAGPRRKGRR